MARRCGLSQSTVSRIWRAFGLQPHRTETFKLSADSLFIEKVRDIVGLYLNPPDRAIVLCVHEKSQIQALDRTRPPLPSRSLDAGGVSEHLQSVVAGKQVPGKLLLAQEPGVYHAHSAAVVLPEGGLTLVFSVELP